MKRFLVVLSCCLFCIGPVHAESDKIELLQTTITPKTAKYLAGMACRNFGRIVHLDITVDWPEDVARGYRVYTVTLRFPTLRFSDQKNEYIIYGDHFTSNHKQYKINDYFFVSDAGGYQGIDEIVMEPFKGKFDFEEEKKLSAECPKKTMP